MNLAINRLWITKSKRAFNTWSDFLAQHDLKVEENVDSVYGLYDGDTIVATGAIFQNIIKCIAIQDDARGGTAFNKLISHLMNEVTRNGYEKIFVYTKVKNTQAFEHLGFKKIEHVEDKLVFMEKAMHGFDAYLDKLSSKKVAANTVAAIVMNANPFTLGHQYLIEQASNHADVVHVFVVSEDRSAFPTVIRKSLIEKGTEQFTNVVIHETDNYIVSSQTFPSYFLTETDDVARVQATLDARIFKYHIAPSLGVTVRYVGEEPHSIVTNAYNEAMQKVFEPEISLNIIPRKLADKTIISASLVRAKLAEGNVEATKPFLPQTTFAFLQTAEGKKIIQHLMNNKK